MNANALQQFLDLAEETDVKDGSSEIDVSEMTRTLGHAFATGLALEVAVDGTESWVAQTTYFGLATCLIHRLWKLDLGHRDGSLQYQSPSSRPSNGRAALALAPMIMDAHAKQGQRQWDTHDLFRTHDAKLHLFDLAPRRGRGRELMSQHDGVDACSGCGDATTFWIGSFVRQVAATWADSRDLEGQRRRGSVRPMNGRSLDQHGRALNPAQAQREHTNAVCRAMTTVLNARKS